MSRARSPSTVTNWDSPLSSSTERRSPLLRLGEGTIGLLHGDLSRWPTEARNQIHIELTTDDLDGLYAELQAKGVQFTEPPHNAP